MVKENTSRSPLKTGSMRSVPTNQPQNERAGSIDERMMERAIRLAGKGQGRVEPNPMVGCVIVRRNRVIGEGYHRRFGGPHAELNALRACTSNPRGATLYVTLEPCCHVGKTPPCTKALWDAGIARVVVAMRDPNKLVDGGGIRALSSAGIVVETGVLADEASELLAPYLTRTQLGRPYVIAKWAQSLNGKLATASGDSRWISCEKSRRMVHRLRARVDAILVGAQTVVCDDPELTARDVSFRRIASRIVLDGRLRISLNRRIVATATDVPTVVMTSVRMAKSPKAARLRRKGVEVLGLPTRAGRLSLQKGLSILSKRDVTNLLVEGGATVISSLLSAGLIDEALVFTAPILIGGAQAPNVSGHAGRKLLAEALSPRSVETRRVGRDMLHRLRFTEPPR